MSLKPLILFDWDGTLADNFTTIKNAHNHVRSYFGLKLWGDEDAKTNIRLSAREYYGNLFGDKKDYDKALSLFLDYVEHNHLDTLEEIQGASSLIDQLLSEHFLLGIVSNKTQKFLDKEIKRLGWGHAFLTTIGAGTAKREKPHPDSINLALSEIEQSYSKVFYVGDTETDMIAAQSAGVDAIFIEHGLGKKADVIHIPNLLYSHDFKDLYNILKEKACGVDKS